MKTLLAATAAIALLTGTAAFAQGEHHGGERGGGQPQGGYHQGGAPAARPQYAPQQQSAAPRYAPQQAPAQHYAPQQYGGARYGGAPGGGAYHQGAQHAYQGQGAAQGYVARPGWGAPGVRPGGEAPHYNRQWFPREIRPDHRYHWFGGYWRPQRGFYYHRWIYGEFLPFGWYEPDYWVGDYWDYGLPVPPYGYAWVRVGPDVLLINLATGFVAETIYGLFF
jgi:Ni/Co efflux regulator RcnB